MIAPSNAAPRGYFVDAVGRRVLIGLTIEETREFEGLERAQAEPMAELVGEAGVVPSDRGEQRWLVLYEKHELAWRSWMSGLFVAIKASLTTGERCSAGADLERDAAHVPIVPEGSQPEFPSPRRRNRISGALG